MIRRTMFAARDVRSRTWQRNWREVIAESSREKDQSPAAGIISNGTSDEITGFVPRKHAAHSRKLAARITTTETMKNTVTAASR